MALLCGCDYCPDGIGGIGRDSVIKLFNKYKNDDILKRLRSWRYEDNKYTALEMRVEDKSICTNCGHLGRTQSHTKKGCGVCRTNRGCDESLWREERLSLKAELALRKKALADPTFPSEEIVEEFQREPKELPKLDLSWRQPNMVKFIKQVGHLLQWNEIYCFQKFFPILTRWQVLHATRQRQMPSAVSFVTPKEIIKKRIIKGAPCLELVWEDEKGFFNGLIPDSQLQEFEANKAKGFNDLWSTVEPLNMMKLSYPSLVEAFVKSKEKVKKAPKKQTKLKGKSNEDPPSGSLENLDDLVKATNEVAKSIKQKKQTKAKPSPQRGLQMIDKFFKQKIDLKLHCTPSKTDNMSQNRDHCSTPLTKEIPSDLESDDECSTFDMSDIVNAIVGKSHTAVGLTTHHGKRLVYETMSQDISMLINNLKSTPLADDSYLGTEDQLENVSVPYAVNTSNLAQTTSKCLDDLDLLNDKRILSNSFRKTTYKEAKRMSLDDSFDVLVKMSSSKITKYKEFRASKENMTYIPDKPISVVDRFRQKQRISLNLNTSHVVTDDSEDADGVSYFFNSSFQQENEDIFEKLMETSLAKHKNLNIGDENDDKDFILLSD